MQLVCNKQEGDKTVLYYKFIYYLRLTPKTSFAKMLNKQRNCAELKQTYGGLL